MSYGPASPTSASVRTRGSSHVGAYWSGARVATADRWAPEECPSSTRGGLGCRPPSPSPRRRRARRARPRPGPGRPRRRRPCGCATGIATTPWAASSAASGSRPVGSAPPRPHRGSSRRRAPRSPWRAGAGRPRSPGRYSWLTGPRSVRCRRRSSPAPTAVRAGDEHGEHPARARPTAARERRIHASSRSPVSARGSARRRDASRLTGSGGRRPPSVSKARGRADRSAG